MTTTNDTFGQSSVTWGSSVLTAVPAPTRCYLPCSSPAPTSSNLGWGMGMEGHGKGTKGDIVRMWVTLFSPCIYRQMGDWPWTEMLLPAATKLGQGNIFTRVCDSVKGGCVVPGGLQFFGEVSANFRGVSNFFGVSYFSGGCLNFSGGGCLQFFGGSSNFFFFKFFFFFFSNLFLPKFLLGCTNPLPPRRSMRGWYASYWNAFLFVDIISVQFNDSILNLLIKILNFSYSFSALFFSSTAFCETEFSGDHNIYL